MSNSPYNSSYKQEPPSDSYELWTPLPGDRRKAVPPLAYTAGGGLIVGIIAGLLLISGGGKSRADAATADETPRAAAGDLIVSSLAPTLAPTDAAETSPDAHSDAVNSNVPLVKEPELVEAHLRFEVQPADIADLEIKLDGQIMTDMSYLVSLDAKGGHKTVKIVASADGYRDFTKRVRVSGDIRIPIEMKKVPKRIDAEKTSASKPRPPPKEVHKTKKDDVKKTSDKPTGPGGMLDL